MFIALGSIPGSGIAVDRHTFRLSRWRQNVLPSR